tara:strand:+ start:10360 stop:11619 length:1260 start_codon:yes stop_codon:yes gene_type:complete
MILEDWIYLLSIILLVVISGFFSGSETAITAVSKARIYSKIKQGNKKAKYVDKLLQNKEELITGLLLSNNLVNVLSSALATAFLYKIFGNSGILYATLIMTILLVIFAEVLPKTYAINRPMKSALNISPILNFLIYFLKPIIKIINFFVSIILRNSTKKTSKYNDEQSEEELKGAIGMYDTSDPDSKHEKEMLQNILTLSDTTVEEIMTHRSNIFSINIDDEINNIIENISNSKFTRIPVWKNIPENIIGILDSRSIISSKYSTNSLTKKIVNSIIKKPWFIPESTDLLDQLVAFKMKKEHLALVVDEYGELLGLVTLEDLIEEIVGDIVDEIDTPSSKITNNQDGSIKIDGSVTIKDLNKLYEWNLPDEDASTIGGFIINLSKRIPLYGEIIKYKNISFKILSHSRKKIIRVEAKIIN